MKTVVRMLTMAAPMREFLDLQDELKRKQLDKELPAKMTIAWMVKNEEWYKARYPLSFQDLEERYPKMFNHQRKLLSRPVKPIPVRLQKGRRPRTILRDIQKTLQSVKTLETSIASGKAKPGSKSLLHNRRWLVTVLTKEFNEAQYQFKGTCHETVEGKDFQYSDVPQL